MKIGSKALGLSILTVLALVALAGSIFLNHKAGFSKRKASQLQVATVPRTPRVFPPVSTGDWSPGSTPPPPAEILTGSLWRSRLEAILKDKAKAMGERDLPPFGLRVLEVFPEGQAQELGITVGDRFLKFNNTLILGNVEFQIARAMTPGKLEVWSPGTGTHDVTVREGRFGVRWEAEWNIHSAYLQSPERDARWDDFVLGACLSWRIDGDAAETALFHAQRAGYHGWITWAIMSRLCHEALHHNEAMAYAWFAKDLAPADGKGPILESFYKSALLLGRLDWALRVCRENPDYYLGCEGWDWTAQRNWHRKLETLPSGQPTPCLLASDPQIPSQPVRGLDNNGEILAGPFRRGIPNSFIYAPSRSFMMFFGPPARNPAFSMEFVMETNENGNEDRPPSVQFSIVDISSGVDEELARIELQQNGTTTVSGSSLPHITTSGAGFFAHDKVLLDIALVGPRCEMRLNGRCAFLGVVPDRPGRELALAVRLWNLKGQFFYIDRKELHGGGGGMIEKTVPSSSPPLPAGGTPLPMPTWYDEEILGAYLKGGARMVTWDEKALETLRLAVPYLKNRSDCTNLQNILLSARQAFQTGCDDPLVLFILDLVHHDVSGTRDWDVTWKFRRSLTRLRERA